MIHHTLRCYVVSNTADKQLLDEVQKITHIHAQLPIEVNVAAIANKGNQFYSESGLLLVQPSNKLTNLRQEIIEKLTSAGYGIDNSELVAYQPHLTIRLGVKLEGSIFQDAVDTFQGKTISFEDWIIFRLELVNGARSMREVHI